WPCSMPSMRMVSEDTTTPRSIPSSWRRFGTWDRPRHGSSKRSRAAGGGPREGAAGCVALQLKDPALAPALANALGSPSGITRRCAVLALGASGDVRFLDDAFDMALDRDHWIRGAGLDAVAMWGATAAPKLEGKLTSTGAGAIPARKASVRIL